MVGARMSTRIWLPFALALNCSPPKAGCDWVGKRTGANRNLASPGFRVVNIMSRRGFGLNLTMKTVDGIGMNPRYDGSMT
jgi:hypothetical protein